MIWIEPVGEENVINVREYEDQKWIYIEIRENVQLTFISSSGSKRGIPSFLNLDFTSRIFFNVFSLTSNGKRSFEMTRRMLLKL